MRSQTAAFLALLESAEGLTVYRADDVPGEAARARHYVVAHFSTPSERPDRYGAAATTHGYTVSLMHVGTSDNEVLYDAEKSRAVLRRVRLTESATPLKLIDSGPILADEQTQNPRIYTATDVWRWADTLA